MEVAGCRAPVSSGGQVWIVSHPEHLVESRSALPDTSPSTTKQRRGPGDKSSVSRHPAGRAAGGARGRAARPADSGVMAHAAPTGDVADIVRMDARAVEVVLLVARPRRSAPAGTRPAQDARPAGRECRHAAHSRRGLQGQLQQLVDPRHEVNGDNVLQSRRRDPHRPACGCAAAGGYGATWRDPPRCAASTFSAMPPTGSTCPARVIWRWACRASRWTRVHSRSRWQCIRSASPSGRWKCAQRAPVSEVELAPDPRLLRRGGGYSASGSAQPCIR